MTSSSCSSSAAHPLKYDVFLNFRGEDTRRGFTSHLCAALRRKGLQTFFDDDDLKRGEEIAQSLPRAIQDSTVAILVFSKDYASSRWCLDELAEIIECHRSHGQIVIPIFYEVDPSHLRKQSHDIAAAFVKHKQNLMNAHKIPRWKDALTKAANLSGFDSKEFRNDDLLINKIVEDILEKLNQSTTCYDFGNLVGMDSRIKEIKRVFTIDPFKINILGIWGMGGVGKTTTAEVIYDIMSPEFEGRCFIHNVRQKAEASDLMNLREELVSKALGEENLVKIMFSGVLSPFLKRILGRKKMLIVLDDVNDQLQLDYLIGDPCWFGAGSMILVTGRNKQVFGARNGFIYTIEPLNHYDALHLFSKSAFNQKYPRDDYVSLSKLIVKYAQGNPLALKVLGSTLNGKNQNEWKGALNQLSKDQNKDIQQVLQISYNGLTRVEKDVFLDIACFFKNAGQIYIDKDILRKTYGFDIDITLSVLIDKCLITSSKYPWLLNMHDLLQEMGKEIGRQEAKYSYQRSRLWDPQDIYEIFVGNRDAEAVETITLDLSTIREMNLNSQVFMKMPNLRFLNFYGESNLHLSQGLDYLPNTLRCLRWDKYPLESFPPNFQPENLVVLELPNSNIRQLWKRAKEDSLVSQLKYGIVNGFWRLTSLSLVRNKNITQLPNGTSGFLEALEVLDLSGCSNLNTFPEISCNMKELSLNKTAIRQIPSSSVERLSKLQCLRMEDCRELESLPSNFFGKLTSLCELHLSGCSRFKVLPEILQPTRCTVLLYLSKTAIEKLPPFFGNFDGSWIIDMIKCPKLAFYPSSENCFSEDTCRTKYLTLPKCNLGELLEDLSFLSFVDTLDLSENDFERIPATCKQLSLLGMLNINDDERLLSLAELPSNVCGISIRRCRSLKEIWTLNPLPLNSPIDDYAFDFRNCLKLDEDECQEVVNALLRNYTKTQTQASSLAFFTVAYLGSRIPEWVKYQSMGDSIPIHLPSYWFNHLFLGFAFYLCVDNILNRFDVMIFHCCFGDNYHFSSVDSERFYPRRADKEHMVVFVNTRFCEWVRRRNDIEEDVAFFKFGPIKNGIKKCGVIPLYAQKDEDEFCGTFDFPNLGMSKLKRSATSAGSFHFMPEKRLKIEEIK